MIYDIFHETKFNYPALVTFSHNITRLTPKDDIRQKLLEHKIEISPTPFETNSYMDYFENKNTFMLIREAHNSLTVTAKSKVELNLDEIIKYNEGAKECEITYLELKKSMENHTDFDNYKAYQYLYETESIPKASQDIRNYALESFSDNRKLFDATYEFMERIFNDFKFVAGFTDVTTPIEVIFREKKGVCQDFAQFAISALRAIGIPARYMSGYIQTYPKKGEKKLFGTDASHAWFSIYIPNYGWVDFDPTNNKMPNHEYIVLGYGRDYLDISPLKGVVKSSGESNLGVRVNVQNLDDEIVEEIAKSETKEPQIEEKLEQTQSQTQS